MRTLTARAIIVVAVASAIATFCIVQDRVTAEGARSYVARQRAALARAAAPVKIDEVLQPAVDRSVRQGLFWGASVLAAGLALATALGTTRPRVRAPSGEHRE